MIFGRQKRFIGYFTAVFFLLCFYANPIFPQTKNLPAKSVEKLLADSSQALSNGNLTEAEMLVQKALNIAPQNFTVQTFAGVVAERKNDLTKAERHFALAAKIAPQSPETRNNYGAILLRLNHPAEAAKEFSASLAANPNQLSALVNLAQIRLSENNLQQARELFERANKISPDAEILRALTTISLQLNETARAAQEFNDYITAVKNSNEAAKNFDADIELGKALLAKELLTEAAQEFDYVLSRDAANVSGLVVLSKVYLKQKNISAAGKLLEGAIAKGLTDARIYLALAEVYQSGGYLENAIPAMRLAIEQDPQNDLYQARYGLLLIDAKAPAAAIIRLTEATAKFPNSAKVYLALAIAQISDGKSVEAKSSLEKSLLISPDYVPALAYLATVYNEQAQYDEAARFYERALKLDESAVLHYLLAETLLKIPTSDPAVVQTHLERSIYLDKTLAQAHFSLGKLLVRSSKWQEAADEFQKATLYSPDLAEAHYQYGRVLARLKRTQESVAEFDVYKKLNETQTAQKETDRRELVRRLANTKF